MTRLVAAILTIFAFSASLHAEEAFPVGTFPAGIFHVANTAGFTQHNGIREDLAIDDGMGTAFIQVLDDGTLTVEINGARIRLFRVKDGLTALEWDASDTTLLHEIDIEALIREEGLTDIPVWGADVDWPGSDKVRLVLLPLGPTSVTGFLISHLQDTVVVRQMEFRKVFGPEGRPQVTVEEYAAVE
ncbi:hypothetical protein FMN50_01695 [Rhodobacterales bacterium]|nr:hypothetical protein FMN50_01695 [Rhodobacterales bacterium]